MTQTRHHEILATVPASQVRTSLNPVQATIRMISNDLGSQLSKLRSSQNEIRLAAEGSEVNTESVQQDVEHCWRLMTELKDQLAQTAGRIERLV